MPATIIPTYRPLHHRLMDRLREQFAATASSLRDLDARALADIGVNASEIASIDAESSMRAQITRRRIAVGLHHA